MKEVYQSDVKQVDLNAVRDELRSLWASEAMVETATIRSLTHNLIVFASDLLGDIEYVTQTVIAATLNRPGRTVLIHATEPNAMPSFNVRVTTYCRPVEGKKVCGELIILETKGALRDEIHSTAVSLLLSDLPVYLWWLCIPREPDHLFEKLADESDRILFDSSAFEDTRDVISTYAGIGSRYRIGDLTWSRITPLRRKLAEIWDVHGPSGKLQEIRTLDVHHVASGDLQDSAGALLLVGWLAAMLNWKLDSAKIGPTGGYITYWTKDRQQVKVEIVERDHDILSAGEVTGVYIQAGIQPPYVMPSIYYVPARNCMVMSEDQGSPNAVTRGYAYRPSSQTAWLAQEIDFGYDPIYSQALEIAAEIIRRSS